MFPPLAKEGIKDVGKSGLCSSDRLILKCLVKSHKFSSYMPCVRKANNTHEYFVNKQSLSQTTQISGFLKGFVSQDFDIVSSILGDQMQWL